MTLAECRLGDLARDLPGATRVFHAHDLDFCCAGRQRLDEAAAARGLDVAAIVRELESLPPVAQGETDWRGTGTTTLIDHLLSRYHEVHRQQLPELIRLARRVEQVHGERDSCPNGLAEALVAMQQELESHMQKEEQVLFPLLSRQASGVEMPISVMRFEHEQHGEALANLLTLAHGFVPPPGACTTWRALYQGLRQLREDLMQHIHLENNILFEGLAGPDRTGAAAPAAGVGRADPASLPAHPAVVKPVGGCGCGGAGKGGGGCA